jgi:hypothetical protein
MPTNASRRDWNVRFARRSAAPTSTDFYLNRRFWFLDRWINHCGYFPSWNLRLFRHPLGRYEQIQIDENIPSGDNEVHEHVLLNGRAEYLSSPMEHYAFPDIATFLAKHDRYSSWEAAALLKMDEADKNSLRATPFGTPLERNRWLRNLAVKVPFRPSLRFVYHYIWKQGFRDGYRGWVLCRLLASYGRMIVSKERDSKSELLSQLPHCRASVSDASLSQWRLTQTPYNFVSALSFASTGVRWFRDLLPGSC